MVDGAPVRSCTGASSHRIIEPPYAHIARIAHIARTILPADSTALHISLYPCISHVTSGPDRADDDAQ